MARRVKTISVLIEPWQSCPPVCVDTLSPMALEHDCLARLHCLLDKYNLDKTAQGLGELAVRLAADYCPIFYPASKQEPETGGRPRDDDRYVVRQALIDFKNKMEIDAARKGKPTRLGSQAAEAFHKQHKGNNPKAKISGVSNQYRLPNAATLRNLLNEDVPLPQFMKRREDKGKILAATLKAALNFSELDCTRSHPILHLFP